MHRRWRHGDGIARKTQRKFCNRRFLLLRCEWHRHQKNTRDDNRFPWSRQRICAQRSHLHLILFT
jgi:hypothetical protein